MTGLFRQLAEEIEASNRVRDSIRQIVQDIEQVNRGMQSELLPIHGGDADKSAEAVQRAKDGVPRLQELYSSLAVLVPPAEFYRYHDHWKAAASASASLVVFTHWLETNELLAHAEVESRLRSPSGGVSLPLDLEDYLIGVCMMSNELPRYVVNRVTWMRDFEAPQRVSAFLSQLFAAFRLLNLRNDALRRRFDGLKYDVKRVEEILYDVRIRGLSSAAPPPPPAPPGPG